MPRFALPRSCVPALLLRFLVLTLALTPLARAMSIVPPTFDELVAESETVVRGTVTAVRAEEFESPQGRGVRTLVTFRVERTLKGSATGTLTLTLLGGNVGQRTLRIVGMPSFEVGRRQLVFVARNGQVICPLIGAGHGRYHVVTDTTTQREYLTRDNSVPLTSTDEIPLPLASAATADLLARRVTADQALSLAAFESRILDAVARRVSVPLTP